MPRLLTALLALLVAPALASDPAALTFVAMGDTPYLAAEEVRWEKEIEKINAAHPAFVLHVGDIKSGYDRCDDAIYARRYTLFARFDAPFVLIPGDNEWTDCQRASNGGFDPIERLAHFRRLFYRDAPAAIDGSVVLRQPGRPEHMRWSLRGVTFITLNVSGSRNGLGISAAMDKELQKRTAANLDWLAEGFAAAQKSGAAAVVIAMHANARLESSPGSRPRAGYETLIGALVHHAAAWSKPVLLIHGDTHHFRVDRPFPQLPLFTRLEVFGAPSVGWVKVTFDLELRGAFRFEPES